MNMLGHFKFLFSTLTISTYKTDYLLANTDIKLCNNAKNKSKYKNTWVKYAFQTFHIFLQYIGTQIEWNCTTGILENQDELKLKTLSPEYCLYDIFKRRFT